MGKGAEGNPFADAAAWVEGVPLAGPKIAATWREYAARRRKRSQPNSDPTSAGSPLARGGGRGIVFLVVQFLLTIIIAAVMYSGGETAAAGMRKFSARFAGKRGEDVVVLASQAVRGVALSVVVTALVQSLLGGLALLVAGVPLPAC